MSKHNTQIKQAGRSVFKSVVIHVQISLLTAVVSQTLTFCLFYFSIFIYIVILISSNYSFLHSNQKKRIKTVLFGIICMYNRLTWGSIKISSPHFCLIIYSFHFLCLFYALIFCISIPGQFNHIFKTLSGIILFHIIFCMSAKY